MGKFRHFLDHHMDIIGFIGSVLCALHCSLLPIVLSMGMLSGFAWMDNHWVEYGFLVSGLSLAGWTILRSYKQHRNPNAIIIAVIGFSIFLIGLAQHSHSEIGLTTLGGVAIAVSHIVNWRILRQTGCQDNSCSIG